MKNILKNLFIVSIISIFTLSLTTKASAQFTACDIFPCAQVNEGDPEAPVDAENVIKFVINTIFVGFIAMGIIFIIRGAITIVRSEGNPEGIESGAKTIKGVMIGLGLVFIGLLGIITLGAIFDATGIFTTEVEKPEGIVNSPIEL